MRGSRFLRVVVPISLFLIACLILPYMYAQETTAGLQGTVKDQSGAVIANATVEVTSPALIGVKKVETDSSGYYRFANLPPGVYTLTATAKGFRTYKQGGIELSVGRLPTMDISLPVGGTAETVEVTGAAPIVDVTQSKVAVTVSEDVLANIPKGRSFQSLIPFAPGARQEPLTSRGRGNTGGIGASMGFQIDGASDSENTYLVEGMDTTNIQDGGVGKNVPMEFVQEVQIKSSGFEAEYGGALGGVVNVVQKRGSNTWHGSVITYLRSDALNGSDQCAWFTLCGLRTDPNFSFSSSGRFDAPRQYYISKKDHNRTIDPGFELGGYVVRDKLWLYSSYMPSFDRLQRTVKFNAPYRVRTFNQSIDDHNALTRLDWLATSRIRTYASWQYGYRRRTGIDLPNPDSILGQKNTSASSDPGSFRQDRGDVSPSSVYNFGADITVNPKLVVTARFGYWFSNTEDRGMPSGNRYLYVANSVGLTGLDGTTLPTAFQNTNGFQNIAANLKTFFDAYKRHSFSSDAGYATKFAGMHNFKIGYGFNRLGNDVLRAFDGTLVRLAWGNSYDPLDPNACGVAGRPACRGNWGYYVVRDGVDNQGKVSSFNHALYAQDAWTVGHGVTLNLGVRFDKEYVPPYQKGAPAVDFGWTQKVAPRLGGAWDVLNNGKLKVFGSFGYFYDIMKYSLPRGSFGGDYWHDCAFTLEDPDYTKIMPTVTNNHFCPVSGAPTGTFTGQFIENVNWRSVILDPTDPGVDPNLKPMKQHEFTGGADWALKSNLGLEVRYTRKRLDYTIEDVGLAVPGNELYYIGNPGYGTVRNLLQRNTIDSSGVPVVPPTVYPPQCPDCPLSPKAVRNYDGLELRLTKQASGRWFGAVSYTYSRLWGNYGGLTSSEITDGSGGRHSPNNSRYFDMPSMAWTSHGTPDMGLLPTDRPHTIKLFSWYRLKWLGHETTIGLNQLAYSGTPISTCWPMVSSQSSCSMVEGRGSVVDLTQAPGSDIQLARVRHDVRSPIFTQTDLALHHEFHISKTNENLRLGFEWNVTNLLNQRAVMAYYTTPLGGGAVITPRIGGGATGSNDWHAMTDRGWNFVNTSNTGLKTLDSRYDAASLFQPSRQMRLGVKVTF